MPAPLALIEDAPVSGERIVVLRGEIDVATAPALRDWLDRASDGGRRSIAVDLAHVDFMAVSGLYVVCDEQARMARYEARLTLVCAAPRVLELFSICRLEGALRIVASRAQLDPVQGGDREDDERSARLGDWLERYAASAPA